MKKLLPIAVLGAGIALSSCENGGDNPTPTPKPDHAPTTQTEAYFKGKVLHIENHNGDIDGDATRTEITVTNKKGKEVYRQDFNSPTINEKVENLLAGTYVIKTVTKSTGSTGEQKATDTDTVERKTQVETTANLNLNNENIKDGMPAGTEVAAVDLQVKIDGETKTVEQLKTMGYSVIVTVDNQDQLQVVDDKKIVLAKPLDRDGEDGNDPAALKYLQGKVKVMVLKNDKDGNGVVVFKKETDLKEEVQDVDDYTPTFEGKKLTIDGKPIVVEKDGKLAKDYVDGKRLFNIENKEAMNNKDVENVIEGGKNYLTNMFLKVGW